MFPVRCWIKSCRWLDWVSFFCVWLQPSKCHTTSVTSYYLCCSILFPQVLSRWLKSNKSKLTSFVWSFSTMFKGLVFSNPLTSSATFNAWAGPPPAELLQEMWAAPAVPPKGVQVWLRLRQPKEFQHFFFIFLHGNCLKNGQRQPFHTLRHIWHVRSPFLRTPVLSHWRAEVLQVPNGQGCAWNVLEHGSVIHIRLIILEELAAMNPAAYPPKDENATSPTSQGNAGSSGRQDRCAAMHDTFFHRLSAFVFARSCWTISLPDCCL